MTSFAKILNEKYDALNEELKNARRHSDREHIKTKMMVVSKALEEIRVEEFLSNYHPAKITRELNNRVIGQPELTIEVANFLYYHMLRQAHPELPPRPMLIAGPSGSGKTEVWRAAEDIFGELFHLQIADGSRFTTEGFKGNYKVSTVIGESDLPNGGILIVDEFDKLVKPRHTASGDNVSMELQSEFLKLIEGEYEFQDEDGRDMNIDSKKMGFVFVGAFDELAEKKKKVATTRKIGFDNSTANEVLEHFDFVEEDYLEFGMMPELVGRIATKCNTRHLSDDDYIAIIRNEHSRVSKIAKVLMEYGIDISDLVSDEEMKALIKRSKDNRTGVRWVSAQIENIAMEYFRTCDISKLLYAKAEKRFEAVELALKEADNRTNDADRQQRSGVTLPPPPYKDKDKVTNTSSKYDEEFKGTNNPFEDLPFGDGEKNPAESSILNTNGLPPQDLFDDYDFDEWNDDVLPDIISQEHREQVSADTAKRLVAIFNFNGIGKDVALHYSICEEFHNSMTVEQFCELWSKTDTFGAMSVPLLKSFENADEMKVFAENHIRTLMENLASDNFTPFDYNPDAHIEGSWMVDELYWDKTREKYD